MQAIFALTFSGSSIGQTVLFSSDAGKAEKAAERVYYLIDRVRVYTCYLSLIQIHLDISEIIALPSWQLSLLQESTYIQTYLYDAIPTQTSSDLKYMSLHVLSLFLSLSLLRYLSIYH